ncbi:hypothetical protein Bca101_090349 [Brassica carinata]
MENRGLDKPDFRNNIGSSRSPFGAPCVTGDVTRCWRQALPSDIHRLSLMVVQRIREALMWRRDARTRSHHVEHFRCRSSRHHLIGGGSEIIAVPEPLSTLDMAVIITERCGGGTI